MQYAKHVPTSTTSKKILFILVFKYDFQKARETQPRHLVQHLNPPIEPGSQQPNEQGLQNTTTPRVGNVMTLEKNTLTIFPITTGMDLHKMNISNIGEPSTQLLSQTFVRTMQLMPSLPSEASLWCSKIRLVVVLSFDLLGKNN